MGFSRMLPLQSVVVLVFLDPDGSGWSRLISTRWVSLCSAHGQSKASLFEKNKKGEKKKIGKARN